MNPPIDPARGRALRVLLVHGPSAVRHAMGEALARAGMKVGYAPSFAAAAAKIRAERPDVVVLDAASGPGGLAFLRRLMARDPLPVVISAPVAGEEVTAALQALDEGAVELVTRPLFGLRGVVEASTDDLVRAVRWASTARLQLRSGTPPARSARPGRDAHEGGSPTAAVVAIAASTGGPVGLRELLRVLPATAPPLVIAQRMPAAFTAPFAAHLARHGRVEIREASPGDRLRPGLALLAPGDRQVVIRRAGPHLVTEVLPARSGASASGVGALFASAALAAGSQAVGVVLSGAGAEGAGGLLAMRAAGARTLAQEEDTAVAFGMAREALGRGAVEQLLPLDRIAAAILAHGAGPLRPEPGARPPPASPQHAALTPDLEC